MTLPMSGGDPSSSSHSRRALRDCFGHFATGVTVVTYEVAEGPLGLTVNAFASVSLEPALLLISIDKTARAASGLSRVPFCVNVLAVEQRSLALAFAGKGETDEKVAWTRTGTVPRLADSLAWIACEPWKALDGGDHILFLGRIVDFGSRSGTPLCFYRGSFTGLPINIAAERLSQ